MMTPEQKRANKVRRTLERFRTLRIQRCIKETATKFQLLVRRQAVESDGKLTCCSCGKRDYPGRGFDAGHWIGRASKATIFDPRNCHPQCVACNRYNNGPVRASYDAFMERTYGREVMDDLIQNSKQPRQWTREELAELYVSYLERLRGHNDR